MALQGRRLQRYSLDTMSFVPSSASAAKRSRLDEGDIPENESTKSGSAASEKCIVDWVNTFGGKDLEGLEVENTSHKPDKELDALGSPFTSSSIEPDITVFYKFDDKQGKRKFPVMLIEVDSSPYEETLHKLGLVLIQHLRWLRHYDVAINETTGFVFPKFSDKVTDRSCVSKMTVTWDDDELKFRIIYQVLQNDESIGTVVRECVERQYAMVSGLAPKDPAHATSFAMPLSHESCGKILANSRQVPSLNSIIVANDEWFAKYNVLKDEHIHMERLHMDRPHLTLSLLPSDIVPIGGKIFLKYDRLLRSMSKEEAKSCLPDYTRKVSEALHELHTVLNLAHLDVRLENICFRKKTSDADQPKYEAVLIDLDRSSRKDMLAATCLYSTAAAGVMYESSYPKFKCGQLDWRQLGILACFCMSNIGGESYHKMMVLPQTDELKELTEGDEPVIPAKHHDTFKKILNGEKAVDILPKKFSGANKSQCEHFMNIVKGKKKDVLDIEDFRKLTEGDEPVIPAELRDPFKKILNGGKTAAEVDESDRESLLKSLKEFIRVAGLCERFRSLVYEKKSVIPTGKRTVIPTDIQKHFRNLLEGEEPKFTEEWFGELKKMATFQSLSDTLREREQEEED